MSRRERLATFRCAEGCSNHITYGYTSQREYAEIAQRQARSPWKCARHERPDEVLRPDNKRVVGVLIATRKDHGQFWIPEGGTTGSGLTSGPGFKAHADDFPEGTRLVVTAEVRTPDDAAEIEALRDELSTRRLRACIEAWPDCHTGGYDPVCCRFPKSCSATVYDPEHVGDDQLEPR